MVTLRRDRSSMRAGRHKLRKVPDTVIRSLNMTAYKQNSIPGMARTSLVFPPVTPLRLAKAILKELPDLRSEYRKMMADWRVRFNPPSFPSTLSRSPYFHPLIHFHSLSSHLYSIPPTSRKQTRLSLSLFVQTWPKTHHRLLPKRNPAPAAPPPTPNSPSSSTTSSSSN